MKQPKICIEVAEDERWLGGAIYIENLLSTLATLAASDQPIIHLSILSNPDTPFLDRLRSMEIVRAVNAGGGLLWRIIKRLDREFGGSILRMMHWLKISSSDSGTYDLWFPALEINLIPRRELYWIPDFQHFYLPHLFTEGALAQRSRSFADIASANGILLLSSQTALKDFVSRYPNARVKPRVWSFCSSLPNFDPANFRTVLARYRLPEKFVYIPNQFWKHKDHLTAFNALKLLNEKGICIPLVCTGYQGDYRAPEYFNTVKAYLEEHDLTQQVYLLGVIPRDNQMQIFRCAAAVLQPSLFEGWSTVIEDAKALGRPIVASNIAVHREQLDGVAGTTFFRASNPSDLADCLAQLWPGLPSGPDIASEKVAFSQTSTRRKESATAFMRIVHEAVASSACTAGPSHKKRGS
ncbi:glycosyltransferase [uncultured Desulfobulbus sp.]|uniref:glycosyltransferase n=1 Tax=uncultured Desulfobulbus sp. TaxID=239745 RepID=UPI0029C6F130|nr:glycosyltransferase [uncultured Desulfobulbus sp.]